MILKNSSVLSLVTDIPAYLILHHINEFIIKSGINITSYNSMNDVILYWNTFVTMTESEMIKQKLYMCLYVSYV